MRAAVPNRCREQDEENEAIARIEKKRERADRAGEGRSSHRRGEAESVRRRDRGGAESVRIDVHREKNERQKEPGHRPDPAAKPQVDDRVAEDERGHRRRPRRR